MWFARRFEAPHRNSLWQLDFTELRVGSERRWLLVIEDDFSRFVVGHVLDAPFDGDVEAGTDIQPAITNFKSALQELAQSRNLPQPRYSVVREKGPEHSKTFTIEVRVGKACSGQADGRTKKVAAQRAARSVYERLLSEDAAAPAAAME